MSDTDEKIERVADRAEALESLLEALLEFLVKEDPKRRPRLLKLLQEEIEAAERSANPGAAETIKMIFNGFRYS